MPPKKASSKKKEPSKPKDGRLQPRITTFFQASIPAPISRQSNAAHDHRIEVNHSGTSRSLETMDIPSDDHDDRQENQEGPSTSKMSRLSTSPRQALGNLTNAQQQEQLQPRPLNARDSIAQDDFRNAQNLLAILEIIIKGGPTSRPSTLISPAQESHLASFGLLPANVTQAHTFRDWLHEFERVYEEGRLAIPLAKFNFQQPNPTATEEEEKHADPGILDDLIRARSADPILVQIMAIASHYAGNDDHKGPVSLGDQLKLANAGSTMLPTTGEHVALFQSWAMDWITEGRPNSTLNDYLWFRREMVDSATSSDMLSVEQFQSTDPALEGARNSSPLPVISFMSISAEENLGQSDEIAENFDPFYHDNGDDDTFNEDHYDSGDEQDPENDEEDKTAQSVDGKRNHEGSWTDEQVESFLELTKEILVKQNIWSQEIKSGLIIKLSKKRNIQMTCDKSLSPEDVQKIHKFDLNFEPTTMRHIVFLYSACLVWLKTLQPSPSKTGYKIYKNQTNSFFGYLGYRYNGSCPGKPTMKRVGYLKAPKSTMELTEEIINKWILNIQQETAPSTSAPSRNGAQSSNTTYQLPNDMRFKELRNLQEIKPSSPPSKTTRRSRNQCMIAQLKMLLRFKGEDKDFKHSHIMQKFHNSGYCMPFEYGNKKHSVDFVKGYLRCWTTNEKMVYTCRQKKCLATISTNAEHCHRHSGKFSILFIQHNQIRNLFAWINGANTVNTKPGSFNLRHVGTYQCQDF
ncbi:hypothetical protein Fcan01_02159 [Folsomia candida]|uniref:Uncharacterized protein n=1 Tax=Folsomia candida TaxID=158441 RepID=A0A226F1N4_FOLCA|nr:hypothetical protein Fcan01_02159 [Folsomia candida]